MITDLLLLIAGFLVSALHFILGGLYWVWPSEITAALGVFVNVFHTFAAFLPWLSTIAAIFLLLVRANVIKYIFKLVVMLFGMIPFIGSHTEMPVLGDKNSVDLRSNRGSNILDLRKGKKVGIKSMRDIR